MRITSKGQVTIPQEIRERFGLLPQTEFVVEGGAVLVRKASGGNRATRERVRRYRGIADAGMTTDEITRLARGED